MKKSSKIVIVAIMLLAILFATGLPVYAAADEEVLSSISQSFTLINTENNGLIDVSVKIDVDSVKSKYGDDVEFHLQDFSKDPYVVVNGKTYYLISQFDMVLEADKNDSSKLNVIRNGSPSTRETSIEIGFSTDNSKNLVWSNVKNKFSVKETGSTPKVVTASSVAKENGKDKVSIPAIDDGATIWFENDKEKNRANIEGQSDYGNFDSAYEKDGTKRKYKFSVGTGGIYQLNAFEANATSKMSGLKLYEIDSSGNLVEVSNFEYMSNLTGNARMVDLTALLEAGKDYVLVSEADIDFSRVEIVYKSSDTTVSGFREYVEHVNPALADKAEPEFFEKVFSFFIRMVGEILNKLIGLIAGEELSIDKLVFDDYSRTQLTFFENDLRFYNNTYNPLIENSITALNDVFSLFRNLALVVYMISLVYLGIRVLLFSTGDKQARYKQVLVDWVKGIAIIFLFPYVIRYTINLNHALVTYLQEKSTSILSDSNVASISAQTGTIASSNSDTEMQTSSSNYMDKMYEESKEGWLAPTICWFIMLMQVFQFLIVYLKRLITVMFLIAIFPLVSISYALDKIADGKSQAFNSWCKEFCLQVFIQSFHAVNYVLVMGVVCKLAPENWLLKIIGVTYIAKGGDVIKNMFAQVKGTKGGGPLEVAKSMLKTKVAISSIKSIKTFASSTFGANSRLGKGLQRIDLARSEAAEGRAAEAHLRRDQAIRSSGYMFTPSGGSIPQLTDNEVINHINDLLGKGTNNLSDDEFRKGADALARMAPEVVERIAGTMGLSETELNGLGNLLTVVTAAEVMRGSRNGKVSAEVKTSADILINVKENIKAGTAEDMVKRYAQSRGAVPSEGRLRGLAAANSIVVDEDSAASRRQARASAPQSTDRKTQVREAMHMIKDASHGYGIEELHENLAIVQDALEDEDLKQIIEEESEDMNFTLEDFELNLYVQTVNNSNSAEFYDNPEARKFLDKSIAGVKEAQENLSSESDATKKVVRGRILAGTNAKIENLNVGDIPVLIDRDAQRNRALQKELDTKLTDLQDRLKTEKGIEVDLYDLLDKGAEHDEYLANKADEYKRMARHDYVAGGLETAAGTLISGKRVAHGTALSGVMVGASAEGKNDVFSDAIQNIPAGYSIVNSVAKEAEDIATIPFSAIDSAVDRRSVGNRVSLSNNRKSVTINEKYYTDQAKNTAIDSQISQAEADRNELLRRLNSRINKGKQD